MRHKRLLLIGIIALSVSTITTAVLFSQWPQRDASAATDPRVAPQLVKIVETASVAGVVRSFTGTIAARVQSNLGFRVPGKIVERLVDVGQQVTANQPLMRIDDTDLRLALPWRRHGE